ncbi:MAG: RtcB family protein [Deltaproteobacteria bacterium]|nr:RtcB family protein [Deltaproteobacteria bacterium]
MNLKHNNQERAAIFADPGVWLEGNALQQFERVANHEHCLRAAGMPDLHAGRGIPIGAVFAMEDAVHPLLIGSDIGCGVRVVPTTIRAGGIDKLERRVRAVLDDDLLAGLHVEAMKAAWAFGAQGLAAVEGLPDALRMLAAEEPPCARPLESSTKHLGMAKALGSAGGGNHFVEISKVSAIHDHDRAEALGLSAQSLVVVAHSGSRGLGYETQRSWSAEPLRGQQALKYLGQVTGACNFARTNRFLLSYRMLLAMRAARTSKVCGSLDLVHNDVTEAVVDGQEVWLHRKGAAPARDGQPTVVLGTRGSATWVMEGRGNAAALWSVAHGAGRRMGRSEALGKLRMKYKKKNLARSASGGRVICNKTDLLYEEHPDAYKDIEQIIHSLESFNMARPVAALEPLITVKQ